MGIVVAFDVFEDFGAGFAGIFETTILKHFVLEGADEGFAPSVVAGVGSRRHALAQACFCQGLAEWDAPVLAAPVAVKDGTVGGACRQSLVERVEDEI